MIHHGDCIEVMATLPEASVDAIVTDPPYNLVSITQRFGKPGSAPSRDRATRANGKPKDGPYQAIARGFMGKEWDGSGIAFKPETWAAMLRVAKPSAYLLAFGGTRTVHRMTCALEDAGWIIRDMLVWGYASGFPKSKASLKPAWEPIVMARKPGPLRMLAIDECRIPTDEPLSLHGRSATENGWDRRWSNAQMPGQTDGQALARWPANIVLTDEVFGEEYSRFFLIPKADRADREPVLGGLPLVTAHMTQVSQWPGHVGTDGSMRTGAPTTRANHHPTVKPTDLMRHLVRLVTPQGGVVLDPFLGSGTTAIAAEMEGFDWIGIEREEEYVAIAEARLNGTQKGMAL